MYPRKKQTKTYKKPNEAGSKVVDCKFYDKVFTDDGLEPEAPVMCTIADIFSGKCATCGWNPEVWDERLRKLGVSA